METFDKILQDYHDTYCDISKEADQIEIAVRELLERFISIGINLQIKEHVVGSKDFLFQGTYRELFKNCRLISVGSFPERTKIGQPDEFDYNFVFCIDGLDIEEGCSSGKFRVIISPENNIWLQFVSESKLNSLGYHLSLIHI